MLFSNSGSGCQALHNDPCRAHCSLRGRGVPSARWRKMTLADQCGKRPFERTPSIERSHPPPPSRQERLFPRDTHVIVIFKPSGRPYTFGRLIDPEDLAQYGPLSRGPETSGEAGNNAGYPEDEVRWFGWRIRWPSRRSRPHSSHHDGKPHSNTFIYLAAGRLAVAAGLMQQPFARRQQFAATQRRDDGVVQF